MRTIFVAALLYSALGADVVLSQSRFYQDKTISVVLGIYRRVGLSPRVQDVELLVRSMT